MLEYSVKFMKLAGFSPFISLIVCLYVRLTFDIVSATTNFIALNLQVWQLLWRCTVTSYFDTEIQTKYELCSRQKAYVYLEKDCSTDCALGHLSIKCEHPALLLCLKVLHHQMAVDQLQNPYHCNESMAKHTCCSWDHSCHINGKFCRKLFQQWLLTWRSLFLTSGEMNFGPYM